MFSNARSGPAGAAQSLVDRETALAVRVEVLIPGGRKPSDVLLLEPRQAERPIAGSTVSRLSSPALHSLVRIEASLLGMDFSEL